VSVDSARTGESNTYTSTRAGLTSVFQSRGDRFSWGVIQSDGSSAGWGFVESTTDRGGWSRPAGVGQESLGFQSWKGSYDGVHGKRWLVQNSEVPHNRRIPCRRFEEINAGFARDSNGGTWRGLRTAESKEMTIRYGPRWETNWRGLAPHPFVSGGTGRRGVVGGGGGGRSVGIGRRSLGISRLERVY
jgi:hypothetical protein